MNKVKTPKYIKYVITISFANYLKNKTGIPKVMMAHQQMYNNYGISYISLFTVKKNILHDRYMLFCMFGLIIDGEFCGIYEMSQLIELFLSWNKERYILLDFHLHHLLYTRIESIDKLLDIFNLVPIKMYLHDYYFCCSNYTLMKNKEEYCGGKGLDSTTCDGCSSFFRSQQVAKQISEFIKKHISRITFISPSVETKRIFTCYYKGYSDKVKVIPHQKFDKIYRGNLEKIERAEKIKIGYLGFPAKHKGWETWRRLTELSRDKDYEFIVFNSSNETNSGMKKVNVAFSKDNLNAMTDALRIEHIQVVVLWANWPETYSYTCFEAFSANAFIITNEVSGNIKDTIEKNQNGLILKCEAELIELFKNPDVLREKVNSFRLKTSGGPLELYENDEIVQISLHSGNTVLDKTTYRNEWKQKRLPLIYYQLLKILNYLYKKGKL